MSRGDLQEMEVGTKPSKTAVNSGAKPAEGMDTSVAGSYEDLGGPTPENYRPDDDSAKLKEPKIKTVKDVVNRGAKAADPMPTMSKEEIETEETVVSEEEATVDEVVAEEETVGEEVNIEDDVNALLGGEELSEEFREKAKIIFEAALRSKVEEIKESLEERYEARLAEELEGMKGALTERVDSYLEYVSAEWLEENQLAVENGLKTEMTESFLSGMRGLFEEHYVNIPEEKYDVVHNMVEKLDEMETKLNEQIEKNINLNKRLAESVADGILDQVSEGLAQTQKEKLASLSESVEFESEEEYREKLEMIKESYFPANAPKSQKTETLSEGVDSTPSPTTGSMEAYLRTLGSFAKN